MSVSIRQKTASGNEYLSPLTHQYHFRRIFLTGSIDDQLAETTCATLAAAANQSGDPIHLVINSPGGSVSAGLAIIDTVKALACPVHTHVLGIAASMAAVIAACGEKGYRSASPSSVLLIHQPLIYGAGGQVSDIVIAADAVLKQKQMLNELLARETGNTIRRIENATDRDTWLGAEEAVNFGLIDRVSADWFAK